MVSEPTSNYLFGQVGTESGIEHCQTKPRIPQAIGMIECFNGRAVDVLAITHYVRNYNQDIPQKALRHSVPIVAMKKCQVETPTLFKNKSIITWV